MTQEQINLALAWLKHQRGFVYDFLPKPIMDDEVFSANNPDHPCAGKNRFIRQKGADFFRDLAEEIPDTVSEMILEELHLSLFDRDPAVRLSIVQTLHILNRAESIPLLERLLELEDESNWVKDAAKTAHLTISKNHGTIPVIITNETVPAFDVTTPRFIADGVFVIDAVNGTRHFGRRVFDIQGGEFDEVNLKVDDRKQILRDIGKAGCIEILQKAFEAQGKPYDARYVIEDMIDRGYTRR